MAIAIGEVVMTTCVSRKFDNLCTADIGCQ